MALVELDSTQFMEPAPADVRLFLREAHRRIECFREDCRIPGFVPSNYAAAYCLLRRLAADTQPGRLFCEWGSGFGVVACMAAMLEFDAFGIEIEPELVNAAQQLAADFDLPVEFVCGSFIPPGSQSCLGDGSFAWLSEEIGCADEQLALAADDFDVIFAYPWPDEEQLVSKLFDRHGRAGAVLVSYHGGDDFRVRRKTVRKPAIRRRVR